MIMQNTKFIYSSQNLNRMHPRLTLVPMNNDKIMKLKTRIKSFMSFKNKDLTIPEIKEQETINNIHKKESK